MENSLYNIVVINELDSSKFRQAAIHFETFGYYTAAPPGTTEYIKFWDEELSRSIHGFRTDEGDFISGYNYFYLNYSRIILTKSFQVTNKYGKTKKVVRRLEDFPKFYDYDRAYFDAIEEAEDTGKHLVVVKKRGAGYSYKGSSMCVRNFYCIPNIKSYAISSET